MLAQAIAWWVGRPADDIIGGTAMWFNVPESLALQCEEMGARDTRESVDIVEENGTFAVLVSF